MMIIHEGWCVTRCHLPECAVLRFPDAEEEEEREENEHENENHS